MSSINRELTTMFNGTTRDEDMIAMRNIGGEILASMENPLLFGVRSFKNHVGMPSIGVFSIGDSMRLRIISIASKNFSGRGTRPIGLI